jgi:hypothetical protein
MQRYLFTGFVILYFSIAAFSQGKDNSLEGVPFKERIVTGGGIGLSFGTVQDFFSLSPTIGYKLTERLIVGTGLTYRYTNYKYSKPSIKLHDYGVSPFMRFTVYKNVFIQAEYEHLNYEFPTSQTQSVRKNFNSFLAGGGFIQPIGNKFYFYLMALYNFSYQTPAIGEYTPYNSPLILRGGINIGNLSFR